MGALVVGASVAVPYRIVETPWAEALGAHRAVVMVEEAAEVVHVHLPWRRRDNPADKRIMVMSASGKPVPHVMRLKVSPESAHLLFGPVTEPGQHFIYYLPFHVQRGWGSYGKGYLKPEEAPPVDWTERNHVAIGMDPAQREDIPAAKVLAFESRTAFDSFYPMEVPMTPDEQKQFVATKAEPWLVFPENRRFPIRMPDRLPFRWWDGPQKSFSGEAMRNEYYTFQLGVFAARQSLEDVRMEPGDLDGPEGTIPANALTCFNTGGIDAYGTPFVKRVDVPSGAIQPLWIGVDIGADVAPGRYEGTIKLHTRNAGTRVVPVALTVRDELLADRGDGELWRHSRLRWLNSTLGIADTPVPPYTPLTRKGKRLSCLGRDVELGSTGLPAQISSWGQASLATGMRFVIEAGAGALAFEPQEEAFTHESEGSARWTCRSSSGAVELRCNGTMEFDGYLHYRLTVKALKDVSLRDIRLEIPMRKDVASLMMGAGRLGGSTPDAYTWDWGGPPHDSFWLGNAFAGLHCELRGGSYHGPLLNRIRPAPPQAWHNGGRGGVRIAAGPETVLATAFSGARNLPKDESIAFEWAFLVTPVKARDTASQFRDRYYHHGGHPDPTPEALAAGVKVVNLHHGTQANPYINYPFVATNEMNAFVSRWQAQGLKVKLYYTLRELSNQLVELWALRSLGDEVLEKGGGGGYPWLREHLVSSYTPRWYQHFDERPEGGADASIANSGESRWYNYYVESLAWLVKYAGMDGLYLDDVSYDRRILKRMRRAMAEVRPRILIDLHSNTGFSKGPAIQYADFYPYVDKLWFGESFQYDQMSPESWMVEVSGIPFGLMGDMLQGGGNRWLGMVYGMTARMPWTSGSNRANPAPVWKVWDSFGIETSRMVGYWDPDCPVKSRHAKVLATAYLKPGKTLISLASWAPEAAEVILDIDWPALGIDPAQAMLHAPPVADFQPERRWLPGDPIPVEPLRGWLIIVESK